MNGGNAQATYCFEEVGLPQAMQLSQYTRCTGRSSTSFMIVHWQFVIYFSQVQKRISDDLGGNTATSRLEYICDLIDAWCSETNDTLRYNELYAAGCFRVRKFETFPAMHCRTHLRRTRLEVARRILGDGSRVELIRCPENDWTLSKYMTTVTPVTTIWYQKLSIISASSLARTPEWFCVTLVTWVALWGFPTRVADATDCNVEVTAWGKTLRAPGYLNL